MAGPDLTGRSLGKYVLEEKIGSGGMGAVYRAREDDLERTVAIKVITVAFAEQPDYQQRFLREAKTAAALEHENIIPIYGYGTDGEVNYLAMRFLNGGSLSERFSEGQPPLSSDQLISLLQDLASALDYAHARKVIHRDIKPSNIMFDQQGNPFLVDFGIAKFVGNTSAPSPGSTGMIGTPAYMPPEQWRGRNLTQATDQYALAVVIYVLLTGNPPFESDSAHTLMYMHLEATPPSVRLWRRDLSPAVDEVLSRALAKNPTERFSSVSDFAEAMKQALSSAEIDRPGFFMEPEPARQTPDAKGQTVLYRRPLTWVVMLGVLAVFMVLLMQLSQLSSSQAQLNATSTAIALLLSDDLTAEGLLPLVLIEPSATPTVMATETATHTATSTFTATMPPTDAPSLTPVPTESDTPPAALIVPPTLTPSPTATASATATPSPSATHTPMPTATLTLLPTLTSTATTPLFVVDVQGANIRSGPSQQFSIVGAARPGDSYVVIARVGSGQDAWYIIDRGNGLQAWIWSGVGSLIASGDIPAAATIPPLVNPVIPTSPPATTPPQAAPSAQPAQPATDTPLTGDCSNLQISPLDGMGYFYGRFTWRPYGNGNYRYRVNVANLDNQRVTSLMTSSTLAIVELHDGIGAGTRAGWSLTVFAGDQQVCETPFVIMGRAAMETSYGREQKLCEGAGYIYSNRTCLD